MPNPEQITRQEKVHRYRCPGCGADLLFEPRDGRLTCSHCGRVEEIGAGDAGTAEQRSGESLRAFGNRLGTLATDALEVRCQTCGATVMFTPPEVADECKFCGSQIAAQPRSADPLVSPESLLPFKLMQGESSDRVTAWLKSRWFAPNALKKFAAYEGARGVYIPFWIYDTHTSSTYQGERGTHYNRTESYTATDAQGNSVTNTREVQETRWESVWGSVSRWFDDILVPATKSLPQIRLVALEPWDLAELKPYDPRYLSGYKALRYQVDLTEGFERVKEHCANTISEAVRSDIGGDEQRFVSVWTEYAAITAKHLLLPVYIGAYRLNQKAYQVVVNARTGEVQGERPYSFWKIFFLVLFLLIVAGLVVLRSKGSLPGITRWLPL